MNERTVKTRRLVLCAVLTGIIVVLQVFTQFIRPGFFPITLALTPIVVGAALCGPGAGAFLGLVFGLMVLFDPATGAFLAANFWGTVVTVLAKGVLSGAAAGGVYRALERYNRTAAALAAGAVSPLVNTGIFFLGCLLFFADYIAGLGLGPLVPVIVTVFIGANFFIELAVNLLLSGVITLLVANGRKILGLER